MDNMQNDFYELKAHGVTVKLCAPGKYYRGTRFDWAGIIRRLSFAGHDYVDEWFDNYDPTHHDCVCGPVEEFTQIGYESALETSAPAPTSTQTPVSTPAPAPISASTPVKASEWLFLKIGVGMLRRPSAESHYDRFNVYEIADPGHRSFDISPDGSSATFRHQLSCNVHSAPSDPYHSLPYDPVGYDYVKILSIVGHGEIILSHCLKNTGTLPLAGSVYDHNFFTLDSMQVGPNTLIDFPFKPIGDWRSSYDNVALTESGIRFSRPLAKGESVFMGNLRPAKSTIPESKSGYSFRLQNAVSGAGVIAECPTTFDYMVFWSNHRVACLEPYIPFRILPGETFSWSIKYHLF